MKKFIVKSYAPCLFGEPMKFVIICGFVGLPSAFV